MFDTGNILLTLAQASIMGYCGYLGFLARDYFGGQR